MGEGKHCLSHDRNLRLPISMNLLISSSSEMVSVTGVTIGVMGVKVWGSGALDVWGQ